MNLNNRFLHILALWTLAVAEPLYQFLAKNPDFLVAHKIGGFQIGLIVVFISLYLPLLIFSIYQIGCQLGSHGEFVTSWVIIFLLFALFCFGVLHHFPQMTNRLLVSILAFSAAFLLTLFYERNRVFRNLLSLLTLLACVSPLIFLQNFTISRLAFSQSEKNEILRKVDQTSTLRKQPLPPVILIIFDEFPIVSLMDRNLQIDRHFFPHFAQLAQDSMWYRNTTAVASRTGEAIGAIVTGRYAVVPKPLSFVGYPENLFTWLAPYYSLDVSEPISNLCPEPYCAPSSAPMTEKAKDTCEMLVDLSYVSPYLNLPASFVSELPDVRKKWKGFGKYPQICKNFAQGVRQDNPKDERPDQFLGFMEKITPRKPAHFHFLHVLLPHSPWEINRTEFYQKTAYPEIAMPSYPVYEAHLLQTQLVDQLLGKLIGHLKKKGMYEDSLLIITADHGINFWEGEDQRSVDPNGHIQDIMRIPLFIKYPKNEITGIDDENRQEIDILPTIAQVLQIEIPWETDGISLLNTRQKHAKKFILNEAKKYLIPVRSDPMGIQQSLDYKFSFMQEKNTRNSEAPGKK